MDTANQKITKGITQTPKKHRRHLFRIHIIRKLSLRQPLTDFENSRMLELAAKLRRQSSHLKSFQEETS